MESRSREKGAIDEERRRLENHDISSDRNTTNCYHCGWDRDRDWECDCEDDESPSIARLEDNGFPPSPRLSWGLKEEDDDDGILPNNIELNNYSKGNNDNSGGHTNRSIGSEAAAGEGEGTSSSFASDFYRCGTDWSSLLLSLSNHENDNQKKKKEEEEDPKSLPQRLKQTNLFQMWGVCNHHPQKKKKKMDVSDQHPQDHHNFAESSSSSHPTKKMKAYSFSAASTSCNPPLKSGNSANNNITNDAFSLLLLRSRIGAKSDATSSITSGGRTTTSSNNAGVADKQRPRVCPFYKKIPGTPFTVDAFCYGQIEGCNAYILSHFHADHYGGLSKGWSHGPIYCTPLTARLVRLCLYVNPIFIHPLELGVEHVIEGIKVTMLEANHCPGAALIHFCLPNGLCYLHTGDFRASKLMHSYPLLVNQRVNVLYLDTTYCNPKYRFPPKEDVLSFVVRVTQNFLRQQPKTLIIVGAYSIGKECVYLAISKALGVKIYATNTRRRILQSFGWPELSVNLCSNAEETPLHILPISSVRFEALEHYSKTYMNQYRAVLAFRPTGWTYSEAVGSGLDQIKPNSRGIVTIYGVPYSEHSSFTELRDFVQFLRPGKIIPTVNIGNAANRDKMQSYFREWLKG